MSSAEDVSSNKAPTGTANSDTDIVNIVIKRPREDNDGNYFECTVPKRSTVGELKELLQQKHPSHPSLQNQQLIYGGRILGDPEPIECIISSSLYQVPEATKPVLYLVVRGEGSARTEAASSSPSAIPENHVARADRVPSSMESDLTEARSLGQSNPQSTQQTSSSTGNAVSETLELQQMLQRYFSQLEVSLRDWSRQLEQLANISGTIARGSSPSEYSAFRSDSSAGFYQSNINSAVQREENITGSQQQVNSHGIDRNPPQEARRQEQGRQQPEVAAPVFQRGFVLQFQVDWQLLIKLFFLVLLLGQDGDPFRFYVLLCFAALVYLYQTGALSGILARISNLLNTSSISRPSNVSRSSHQMEGLPERRTSRFRQTIRNVYLKIYVFLYSFICSLFPAWQPDAAERPPQHED
ncbi:hypothetical protein Gasu2_46800 [Galdieria sulphuraria]|uniref:Ubiquitin-like domain-containing protein n=1 Tax=Galdieria sulphuraria TaxID=130081 RepID=M2Y6N1_GALSU|nr:uncharacterized protein Gasu_10770 [Galdieria sulphuraria]EME31698.1 hypothetical protein Gasu_10770 [Galdieria sulphuraria]GJD10492.1 hypothetical protein Gasu2_46800 [Galdieria sulphuraria]|eukprot:XP_005708218.1 hypothetical protein Gasu_10770 [Galdieria sulphuraria]